MVIAFCNIAFSNYCDRFGVRWGGGGGGNCPPGLLPVQSLSKGFLEGFLILCISIIKVFLGVRKQFFVLRSA